MNARLGLRIGQHSRAGRKADNQDSLGARYPEGDALVHKGAVAVIADGVSASVAAREAAEACVKGFLHDYYSTPDSWSVETSVGRVLGALNRWLHGRGQSLHGTGQGMVCTLSGVILKSNTAYVFHVGDSRVHLWRNGQLECLTRDHHVVLDRERRALSRGMGLDIGVDIDFRRIGLEAGDRFLLTTDGVHDVLAPSALGGAVAEGEPGDIVVSLAEAAFEAGSTDNLSAQVLEVGTLPADDLEAHYQRLTDLPFPPLLSPGQCLDGYRIVRELHASNRTQVYLATADEGGDPVVIKTPSPNFEDDPAYIDHFMTESWVGRRLDNPHLVRFRNPPADRQCLYSVSEYVDGPTLREWMNDHPRPALSDVRDIIQQIAVGLRALHRLEMVHQDLKPENIVIDGDGTVKIIDLGSVRIRGIEQVAVPWEGARYRGTERYAAPECLDGALATPASDRYSLAVIAYEMLTARLPYRQPPRPAMRRRHRYRRAGEVHPEVPAWLDACLEKAVALRPDHRYEAMSAFLRDLSHPNPALTPARSEPLAHRMAPETWRFVAALSLLANVALVGWLMVH